MYLPQSLYWYANVRSLSSGISARSDGGSKFVAGIKDPLIVVAHAELNLPQNWAYNESDFLSLVEVTRATECALSICARKYNVSVTNGIHSVHVLDEDFGSLYIANANIGVDDQLCWKPSSSPMTDWNKTGQREGLAAATDPADYEFCGVMPDPYYDTLPLSGFLSWVYRFETVLSQAPMSWLYMAGENPHASSPDLQRVGDVGLETLMGRIASAVSKLARAKSNSPIYGVVITQDSYVAVQWPWLTLPAVLLVAGTSLLVATALITTHEGASLWKSSVLPLLFHGLEPNLITRDTMMQRGFYEATSDMEQVAAELNVELGLSDEGGRTILRGDTQDSEYEPTVQRIVRRRTF
ncbi:hypothetical protein CBS147323_480 [Aspergillus niger]|nr:hypothetical protein CBS147323_480 [Aspergillus niger]KAI3033964.1 hypothetical protein CBS147347_432 [Aspergillus niger]KAI3087714.1 hypothetical protein CBS147353_632 [Aspergillus niger]